MDTPHNGKDGEMEMGLGPQLLFVLAIIAAFATWLVLEFRGSRGKRIFAGVALVALVVFFGRVLQDRKTSQHRQFMSRALWQLHDLLEKGDVNQAKGAIVAFSPNRYSVEDADLDVAATRFWSTIGANASDSP